MHTFSDPGANNPGWVYLWRACFYYVEFQEESFIKRISVPSFVLISWQVWSAGGPEGAKLVKKVARLSREVIISCFHLHPQHAAHNSLSSLHQESKMAGFLNHYPPYPVNGLNMPPRTADMFSPMVAPPYGKPPVFLDMREEQWFVVISLHCTNKPTKWKLASIFGVYENYFR